VLWNTTPLPLQQSGSHFIPTKNFDSGFMANFILIVVLPQFFLKENHWDYCMKNGMLLN